MNLPLTESQQGLLMTCLEVAAEEFAKHAKDMRELYDADTEAVGYKSLADQFTAQEAETRALLMQVGRL